MHKHSAEIKSLKALIAAQGQTPQVLDSAKERGPASSRFDRAKLVDLMEVFQIAVIEVASGIESEKNLSPGEIQDRRYVAGMATVSAANCEMLLAISEGEEKDSLALYDQFMSEAEDFALAIKSSGLIKEDDDVVFH